MGYCIRRLWSAVSYHYPWIGSDYMSRSGFIYALSGKNQNTGKLSR